MIIEIIKGDLLTTACDAVVNPTDSSLSASGGIDKKIRTLCGEKMQTELEQQKNMRKNAPFEPAACICTSADGMAAQYVLHTVIPRYRADQEENAFEKLADCCRNILRTAEKAKIKHIAMPAIGCGNGGYPIPMGDIDDKRFYETPTVILSALVTERRAMGKSGVERVTIVCRADAVFQLFMRTKEKLLGKYVEDRDRIRGSLLGGAVGDAFGYPIEFMIGTSTKIHSYVINSDEGKAIVSDDTQMTLFTACAVLYAETRGCLRGIQASLASYAKMAYMDWLYTQDSHVDEVIRHRIAWIASIKELNVRRAPGNTCLKSLRAGGGTINDPINNSKGCGAVMRVAPIALRYAYDCPQRFLAKDCAEVSAITHGHPLGWLSSVALGNILRDLMFGFSVDYAVEETICFLHKDYSHYPDTETMIMLLEKARELAQISYGSNSYDLIEALPVIRELGAGWVGEEALAVAVFSVLACKDSGFDRCIYNAACHDGDSDSTASIAGQIWGAAFGLASIDRKWLEPLELRDIITEIADDLTDGCQMDQYSTFEDVAWTQKYCEVSYPQEHTPKITFTYATVDSVLKAEKKFRTEKCSDNKSKTEWQYEIVCRDNRILRIGPNKELVKVPSLIIQEPEYNKNTGLYESTWGKIYTREEGLVVYYADHSFRMIKDGQDCYQILSEVDICPWIGTAEYGSEGTDNIWRIKILKQHDHIMPAVQLALANIL